MILGLTYGPQFGAPGSFFFRSDLWALRYWQIGIDSVNRGSRLGANTMGPWLGL